MVWIVIIHDFAQTLIKKQSMRLFRVILIVLQVERNANDKN